MVGFRVCVWSVGTGFWTMRGPFSVAPIRSHCSWRHLAPASYMHNSIFSALHLSCRRLWSIFLKGLRQPSPLIGRGMILPAKRTWHWQWTEIKSADFLLGHWMEPSQQWLESLLLWIRPSLGLRRSLCPEGGLWVRVCVYWGRVVSRFVQQSGSSSRISIWGGGCP